MTDCDVTIIGAGPYGLAAAAHLRTIKGLEVRAFGEPMSFWERNMPAGMLLRSNWTATQIADPGLSLTLEDFQAASGVKFAVPVPRERFVEYGQWYQRQAVPDLEQRKVLQVGTASRGFRVLLDSGEEVRSRRVMIAAGIGSFTWRPLEFRALPAALVSHTSEHSDFQRFAGQRVVVVGGGQSALESAALLHEAGAATEVIARCPRIHWLAGAASRTLHHGLGRLPARILYAPTDVGPAGISQLMARPHLVQKLPRSLQNALRKRSVRPAGARWLVDRLQGVPIQLGRRVVSAVAAGSRLRIKMDDGSTQVVDHLLLGTGYRVDVSKYEFLGGELAQRIDRVGGYPRLREGFETSVPGLHMLGAPAVWSYGPLMQFVSGTTYASRVLTRHVAGNLEPRGQGRVNGRAA